MTIDLNTIITVASFLTALITIATFSFKIVKWVDRQNAQDAELKEIKAEQKIITTGILACLKGLAEQGCDGPVHQAISDIEAYQIEKAHK